MFWIVIGLITAAVAWYFIKQRGAPDAAVPASTDTPAAPKPAWGKRVVSPAGAALTGVRKTSIHSTKTLTIMVATTPDDETRLTGAGRCPEGYRTGFRLAPE